MQTAPDPGVYHRWYDTPRGRWIGDVEFELVHRLLRPKRGDSILDVGCGTGYFTHRFASAGYRLTGVDPAIEWLSYAAARAAPGERYVGGRAQRLPFPDRSFDHSFSIAALCFMPDPKPGVAEMLRVTRRRFAVGLLNRQSLLYRQKGRGGGTGAYRGARWYTAEEVRAFLEGLVLRNLRIRTAVFEPGAGVLARLAERLIPKALPYGAFIVASGEIV